MKLIVILGVMTALSQGRAQTIDMALKDYESGRWNEAYQHALAAVTEDKEPAHQTAYWLLLAQIAFQQGDYHDSYRFAESLLQRYRDSRHEDAAQVMAARSSFYLGSYQTAARHLLAVTTGGRHTRFMREAHALKLQLYRYGIPYAQLSSLVDSLDDHEALLGLAERLVDHGRPREAIEVARSATMLDKPSSRLLQDILERAKSTETATVKVAIIVSLSGAMSEVGRHILEGTTLAFQEYNQNADPRIELLTFDDQSDIVKCIQAAQTIAETDDIALVIGPAESQMMAAVAGFLNRARIPVISPTATKSGLTDIGPFVFQANTPLLERTQRLAAYVTERLKFKTFAILAPSDSYGENAADMFGRIVEKNGGRIVANERFYDNTVDFRTQLLQIRKRGLLDMISKNTQRLSLREIDSIYSVYYPVNPDNPRDHDTPLKLDAIFLPIYTDDIKYVAPQMAFYNIQATFLGEDSWVDINELRLHQPYVKGAIVVSEYFINPKRDDVRAFNERYTRSFGHDPAKESYYGFDLANAMASLIRKGATTSDRMYRALRQGIEWKGLHNDISLSKSSGANSSVHLLQFKDGVLHRLD